MGGGTSLDLKWLNLNLDVNRLCRGLFHLVGYISCAVVSWQLQCSNYLAYNKIHWVKIFGPFLMMLNSEPIPYYLILACLLGVQLSSKSKYAIWSFNVLSKGLPARY